MMFLFKCDYVVYIISTHLPPACVNVYSNRNNVPLYTYVRYVVLIITTLSVLSSTYTFRDHGSEQLGVKE